MTRLKPVNQNYYHIFNRGVDKRIIFKNNADYARFLHSLYFCNDVHVNLNNHIKRKSNNKNGQSPTLTIGEQCSKRLVDVVCFGLMPNHYHLLLKQLVENGIPILMQRLGTAYTKYFNIKHERNGVLFQGKYKIKFIEDENYLFYLTKYIHLNPIEIIDPKWKENGINNWKQVNDFLESYKWSSYMDYIGIKNFPSIINKESIGEYYKNPENYRNFINSYFIGEFKKVLI